MENMMSESELQQAEEQQEFAKARSEDVRRQIQYAAAQQQAWPHSGIAGAIGGAGIYRPRDPDELCRNECLTAALHFFHPNSHTEALKIAGDFYAFMKGEGVTEG